MSAHAIGRRSVRPLAGRAGPAVRRPVGREALRRRGLTDVPGVAVGHFTDTRRPTGCTAVLTEEGATCGVDVRGGAPGTRETALLDPVNMVSAVHGVLLAGGSAFGLDAAGGVMRHLEERGRGFAVGERTRAPSCPPRSCSTWPSATGASGPTRPWATLPRARRRAVRWPRDPWARARARRSASCGGMERAMKGGLGTASIRLPGGPRRARRSRS